MAKIPYLDLNKVLSYDVPIMMILGVRGCGKTYGVKKRVVKNFVKKSRKFIYLFRNENKMKRVLATSNLFSDINNDMIFDEEIECKSKGAYYGEEHMGYFIPLSMALDYKSASFADVDTIIFDEFLIEENQSGNYIRREPELLQNLIDTVFRNRSDMEIFLLGNATTIYNPYALYYHVDKPYYSNVAVSKDRKAMIYLAQDEQFIEFRKTTSVGQLVDGTAYGDFALYNNFQAEKEGFICKKPKCNYLCTILYDDFKLGIWISNKHGLIWVSEDVDPSSKNVYALTANSHSENTLLIKNARGNLLQYVMGYYKAGCLRFENQKVKELFNNVLLLFI